MDFFLFLVVNATLFIRPAEIVPELIGLPIYNVLILTNLIVALPKILGRLSLPTLRAEPITVCVLGLLVLIPLSHLSHFNFFLAREGVFDFGKVVLYYLLLVAVIDTPTRLRQYLAALVVFVTILTALAVLHYYGAIEIPSLDAMADREIDAKTGEEYMVMRLCSTGIYHDPNDLSLILIEGGWACLFLAGTRLGGFPKGYWLVPAGGFLYALTLTHSKGGFLALLAGMMSLFYARFGIRKAILLAILALPAMFILFAGRQTSISADDDTSQDRLQLWAEGFAQLRQNPCFGIGQNLYAEKVRLVAHNSYVHAFTELGVLGGVLFLGAFAFAARTLLVLGRHDETILNLDLRRFQPCLLAMIVSYGCGLFLLSRNYVVPTYMVLGLVTVYLRLVSASSPRLINPGGPIMTWNLRLFGGMALAGFVFLVATNLFIRLFVHWG